MSVQTTAKYIGCRQRLRAALNDDIGIEPVQSAFNGPITGQLDV
jgi:hypothetical protein